MAAMGLNCRDIACEGGMVRVVTFDDMERRNALTPERVAELDRIVMQVNETPEIGALVLAHEGSVFCAGTDVEHLSSILGDANETRLFLGSLVGFFASLERCEKMTVAAIEGAAVGGGFEMALACDIRILGADAWIRLPEILLGTIPGGGGVQRLTRFVGRGEASAMVLLGEKLDVNRCVSLGLARQAPAQKALETAIEIGKLATARSRAAVAEAKELIRAADEQPLEILDEMAVEAMVRTLFGPEGREGIRAMRERNSPDFATARRNADA
jgi:enoyl-CoA hydratase/carnithine racemase